MMKYWSVPLSVSFTGIILSLSISFFDIYFNLFSFSKPVLQKCCISATGWRRCTIICAVDFNPLNCGHKTFTTLETMSACYSFSVILLSVSQNNNKAIVCLKPHSCLSLLVHLFSFSMQTFVEYQTVLTQMYSL